MSRPNGSASRSPGLQRRGYTIRPLAEMLRLRRLGLPLPARTVVLTFDDGFASVHRYAWPILRELQAPATIFLCTAYLDSEAPFPFDPWAAAYCRQAPPDSWRPLRLVECRDMLASGLNRLCCLHAHAPGFSPAAERICRRFRDQLPDAARAVRLTRNRLRVSVRLLQRRAHGRRSTGRGKLRSDGRRTFEFARRRSVRLGAIHGLRLRH